MRIRMTKEVLVTISGLQFSPETENESVELITSGSYYKKNGKHYIIYDEVNEGFSETTRNIIKLKDDFMDITRRGVSNVHMMFEKNRKNVTYYYTPYGSLLIGIDAKSVDVQETENDIDVKEVLTGQDCGLNIESFNDIRVGDVIEGYEQVEVKRN